MRASSLIGRIPRGSRAFSTKLTELGQYGLGGRCSNPNLKVALFGVTGFLGRYVANEAGKVGCTVYIANRGCTMETRHLQPFFDLGNAAYYVYSPRDEDSIREIIRESDVVINMIGKYYETKGLVPVDSDGKLKLMGGSRVNFSFEETHVDIAQRLAKIAKEEGASRFIQVSALAASPESKSEWARSKARGEAAVLKEFPEATIVRPATLFGCEDRLLNLLAFMAQRLPAVPMVEDGSALFQPVYVGDVAKAIMAAVNDEDMAGRTLELAGPADFTRKEIMEFVYDTTRQMTPIVPVPKEIMAMMAMIGDQMPEPYLTPDDVNLQLEDQVLVPKEGIVTLKDLGIQATPVENKAFQYLHRFRKAGHFVNAEGYH